MADKPSQNELENRIVQLEQVVAKHKLLEYESNQIFSMSLDLLCVADLATATFLRVNPAFTTLLGYSEQELLGRSFLDFIHPHDVESTRLIIEKKLLVGEKAINFENRYRCKDGSYKWLSWMSQPNIDEGVTYAVARDVTVCKQANEKLLLNQKQLQKISKIGMVANSTLELEAVLGGILKSTLQTLNGSAGMISLKDPNKDCLLWGASLGLPESLINDFHNRPIHLGEGLVGLIGQTGETIYIPHNASADPRVIRLLVEESELNSFIGVPIYAVDKLVGVMIVLTRAPLLLTEYDLDLCTAIGSHVGFAIRNAQLFDQQKQAEELRCASENRFEILSNLTFEGILLHDKGVIIDVNKAFADMFGYTKEELFGENMIQLLLPLESQLLVQGKIAEKIVKPYEIMVKRRDGTLFPVEVAARVVEGESFKVVAVRDISGRKESENALRESEERFRELFNNMGSGVAIYDVVKGGNDFIFRDVNRAGVESSKLNYDQLVGKSVLDVFPGIQHMGLLDVFKRVWQTGIPEHFPSTQYKDERITQWMENYVCKIPSGEIVAIYEDITERKKTEDELLRVKEEWVLTFNAMRDIVTIQDKDMRIVQANKAAYDFFGEEYGELEGKYCYEVFTKKSTPCSGCPLLVTLHGVDQHAEIMHLESLGKTFHVSSSVVADDTGEIQYLIHVARDISELKKLEEDLFQAHKMEAIGTLAGGIAHDFNNILSAIIGYSELAKLELPPDSDAAKDIDQVLTSGKRAADLVQQILMFSRKSKQETKPIIPRLIINEALKMLRASIPVTIVMKQDIAKDCGKIMADPTNIHQIIVNLCTNAVHAMADEKGVLNVILQRREVGVKEINGEPNVTPGSFIVLEVMDTGQGMNQVTRERIFDPYFTTKELGEGTGLGLAVIHGIIQDYHGFIRVQSEQGKGTAFQVYFPALQQEEVSASKPEVSASLPTGSEQILVVDDELMIVDMHKAALQRLGYKVSITTDSRDALEQIRVNPDQFDLLITDQTMPNMTGAELAQEVLKIKPTLPIILCTGYSSILPPEHAKAIGIKKYIRKPVDRALFAQMVRQVLDEN